MKKYVTDTSVVVNDALDKNEKVLFEGAQGVILIDEGTYPYVTSSNTILAELLLVSVWGANRLNTVLVSARLTLLVLVKVHSTELLDEVGDRIQWNCSWIWCTVTGRPRRVGWFDSVALRHAKRVAGINALSLNLLDVFSGFDKIKIATAYELMVRRLTTTQQAWKNYTDVSLFTKAKLPAWDEDITNVKTWEDLPENAKKFLNRVSELVSVPLVTVSVGPDREQPCFEESLGNVIYARTLYSSRNGQNLVIKINMLLG